MAQTVLCEVANKAARTLQKRCGATQRNFLKV
jgi:hypothetical protein